MGTTLDDGCIKCKVNPQFLSVDPLSFLIVTVDEEGEVEDWQKYGSA